MSTLFKLMNARNDSGAEQQWEMLNLWKKRKEERESSCIFRHIMICVCSLSSPPLPNQLSEWVKMWSDKLTLLPVDTRSWALCSLLLMFHFFFSTQNVNAVRICENREEKALWHVVNSHTAAHLCVRRRPTSRLTLDTTEDKTRYQTSHPKLSREKRKWKKWQVDIRAAKQFEGVFWSHTHRSCCCCCCVLACQALSAKLIEMLFSLFLQCNERSQQHIYESKVQFMSVRCYMECESEE